MGTVSVSLPSDGQTIDAADYNTPITSIVNEMNGNIDNANIKTGAAIATSKLATDAGIVTGMIQNGAVDYTKAATGFCVQIASTETTEVVTGTTLIPYDDTVPQNTEGNEMMTVDITPKSATNILEVEVFMFTTASTDNNHIAALFRDSTAGALAVTCQNMASNGATSISLRYRVVAGSTSTTTFKVRLGGNAAGTFRMNGGSGSTRLFGATTKSSIVVREYRAS